MNTFFRIFLAFALIVFFATCDPGSQMSNTSFDAGSVNARVNEYAEFTLRWINQGATIVGGCCEVGPKQILEVYRMLVAKGHEIV